LTSSVARTLIVPDLYCRENPRPVVLESVIKRSARTFDRDNVGPRV